VNFTFQFFLTVSNLQISNISKTEFLELIMNTKSNLVSKRVIPASQKTQDPLRITLKQGAPILLNSLNTTTFFC